MLFTQIPQTNSSSLTLWTMDAHHYCLSSINLNSSSFNAEILCFGVFSKTNRFVKSATQAHMQHSEGPGNSILKYFETIAGRRMLNKLMRAWYAYLQAFSLALLYTNVMYTVFYMENKGRVKKGLQKCLLRLLLHGMQRGHLVLSLCLFSWSCLSPIDARGWNVVHKLSVGVNYITFEYWDLKSQDWRPRVPLKINFTLMLC